MRKVIRYAIWESNSSSMHTLTVRGKRNVDNSYYPSNVNIEICLDEYGWDGDPCDDFRSKLAYAMSMVLNTEYPEFHYYHEDDFIVDQNILESLDGYKLLLDAINKHVKCERVIIKRKDNAYFPYGYIDHQSYEDYGCLQDFLDDWNVDAERYLFDDGVVVHIDNDNH